MQTHTHNLKLSSMFYSFKNQLNSFQTFVATFLLLLIYYLFQKIFFLHLPAQLQTVNKRPRDKKMFSIKVLQFEKLNSNTKISPKARSGHRLVSDQVGNLYSLGGFNSNLENDREINMDPVWRISKPLFRELWKFNVSTNKFIKIPTTGPFPEEMASHCVALLNDHLLISFGGTAFPFNRNLANNVIYLCDLKTRRWRTLDPLCKASDIPTSRYGQALCVDHDEEKIYLCGGTDGFRFSIDVHVFDFKTKLWTQLSSSDDSVPPRYRHEMTLFENKLFIFGGGTSNQEYGLKMLPVFDLKSKQWTQVKTTGHLHNGEYKEPSARKCHIICRKESFVYLIGGVNNLICNDLWRLDLRSKQWTLLIKQIPIPVFFHAACISPYNQLTFFGGSTNSAEDIQVRSDKIFSVWVDVVPLKEMAWRALLYYCDNFKGRTDAELTKMGLTQAYIQRLKD